MVSKNRLVRLERLTRQLAPPGDRVEVIEVHGDRGRGEELLEVIQVRLIGRDGKENAGSSS